MDHAANLRDFANNCPALTRQERDGLRAAAREIERLNSELYTSRRSLDEELKRKA